MKKSSWLILLLSLSALLSTNWRCTIFEGDDFSIQIDSLNNPLLYSVDVYALLNTDDLGEVVEVGFCWNQTGNPTIEDSTLIFLNPAIKEIQATVSNLSPSTTYFLRAFTRNDKKLVYSQTVEFTTWDGTLTDVEGHPYKGTQVGNQGWMAENLRATKYADGSPITINNGTNRIYWYGSGHTYVPNFDQDIDQDGDFDATDSLLYVEEYGLLYSWFGANNVYDHSTDLALLGKKIAPNVRDICPEGWHLPAQIEIQTLTNYLASIYGYEAYAHHLTTQTGWFDNLNGLDTYQFSMKPGGLWHDPMATHTNLLKQVAYLWTSTEGNEDNGAFAGMDNLDKRIYTSFIGKAQHALCIRCIKNK
jgi:uncharacterized protein (TIGR02145 family)